LAFSRSKPLTTATGRDVGIQEKVVQSEEKTRRIRFLRPPLKVGLFHEGVRNQGPGNARRRLMSSNGPRLQFMPDKGVIASIFTHTGLVIRNAFLPGRASLHGANSSCRQSGRTSNAARAQSRPSFIRNKCRTLQALANRFRIVGVASSSSRLVFFPRDTNLNARPQRDNVS